MTKTMKTIGNRKPATGQRPGFTLIELLVVISIIGVLAAFTIPVLKKVKDAQYKKVARAELDHLEVALNNYKAKYGSYPPDNKNSENKSQSYYPALYNQLYYELSGVTLTNGYFVTLDGSTSIKQTDYQTAYGVGGVINCTKGTGEDATVAQNFLVELKANQFFDNITNQNVRTTELVTSLGGPDRNYEPIVHLPGQNPFRYVYPGVHNPNSYDLWLQLDIGGKTNLICNWSREVQINAPLP